MAAVPDFQRTLTTSFPHGLGFSLPGKLVRPCVAPRTKMSCPMNCATFTLSSPLHAIRARFHVLFSTFSFALFLAWRLHIVWHSPTYTCVIAEPRNWHLPCSLCLSTASCLQFPVYFWHILDSVKCYHSCGTPSLICVFVRVTFDWLVIFLAS